MAKRNPYTVAFGKIPTEFISRTTVIDSITEAFTSEQPDEQAFKITGMRGTGKTVMLSTIEKSFRKRNDFIVLDLSCGDDILKELAAELYSEVPSITKFIDANLNLSAFGIGISVGKKPPVASINIAIKELLKEIKKQKKRLLILMDEARKTTGLIDFIQAFQIYIRNDLPIFLVVAGLYEDIESIENSEGITFFLRATKFEMTPLNLTYIRDNYKKNLSVSPEEAGRMAQITKGYAFAYQVLGKYMWDDGSRVLTDSVLQQMDETLSERVYKKIWCEIATKDRYFLQFIAQKDKMAVSELLEETKQNHSAWSVPRQRLKDKGIIDVSMRGMISMRLPRFKEFVEAQLMEEAL